MKNKTCVGGFLMRKDKFLFGKRSKDKSWAAGVWDIVGGKALKHEKNFDALARETFEELGIVVETADLLRIVNVEDKVKNNSFRYYIYMITSWRGEPTNTSAEHTEINWFTRDQLNNIPIALPDYLSLIDSWLKEKVGNY